MPFVVIVACAPPARTLAARFESHPEHSRTLPPGALGSVGGSSWGPSPDSTQWSASRLVWLESGRWATGSGTTWTLWDPAAGWVRSVEAPWSARPTPDGAWLAPEPIFQPSCTPRQPFERPSRNNVPAVRFDPEVVVDRRRTADVDSVRMLWDSHGASAADLPPGAPARRDGCSRSWTFGDERACARDSSLVLERGGEVLAEWPLDCADTFHGPAVSVGWSGDGKVFAWNGYSRLTTWADGEDRWSVAAPDGTVEVSPDGSLVVVLVSGAMAIYDAADGTRLDPERPGEPTAAALGPEGRVAARTLDHLLTWDPVGRPVATWPVPPPKGDPGWEELTWGADGLCVGMYDARAECFDADGQRLGSVAPLGMPDDDGWGEPRFGIGTVAREGRTLTLRSDGALVVWPTP